jgi:V8-like Glu-specific endopeptidase
MKLSVIRILLLGLVISPLTLAADQSESFRPEMKDQLKPMSEKVVGQKDLDSDKTDFAIIGRDERYQPGSMTSYPIATRGQLVMTMRDGKKGTCSATLISSRHLLTAAHCAYAQETSSFMQKIEFIPARNGAYIPYGIYGVQTAYIPRQYKISGFGKGNADIAVLELATPLGNQLGHLGYGVYQGPPEILGQQINQEVNRLVESSTTSRSQLLDQLTRYFSKLHTQYPEHSMQYFGYSNDTNSEMWGDKCFARKSEEISTEQYGQMQTFCDLQGGASGSSYTDNNGYIRGVVSWAKSSKSSEITDSSGRSTGNFQGNIEEVANVGHAITNYTFGLIGKWTSATYGEETSVKRYSNALDTKRILINNKCNQELYIALRYKNGNGDWVNDGYYPTPRYSEVAKGATSDYFYYYAISKNGSLKWQGSDSYQTFYGNQIGLKKHAIGSNFDTKINLTCG